jgi:hypothetical protein
MLLIGGLKKVVCEPTEFVADWSGFKEFVPDWPGCVRP